MAHLTCKCLKIDQTQQRRKQNPLLSFSYLRNHCSGFWKHAPMCWDLYEHRRQRCGLVHITELNTVTPLPGDQHWPPAPHLYKPNVLLPFLALNVEEESRQSQRCSRSLTSLTHNASKPSGSKETPRWSAQTQQSPSVCSQGPVLVRMSGDGAWPGSAKPTLPGSRLPRSKAPTKAFFSVSTCYGMKCFP